MELLRRGDTGPVVAEIRAILSGLGLLTTAADAPTVPVGESRFDDGCDRAVRGFQQQRGLSVDGVVGQQTYRALDEARWRLGDRVLSFVPLRPFRGDDVQALQQRLLEMGYDVGRCDAVFGPATEAALRGFQRDYGLTADGTCGPQTLRSLSMLERSVRGGRPQLLREQEALHRAGPTLVGKSVVVDPGHGGSDLGAVAGGVDERSVVQDLGSRLEGRLTAAGMTAYLSHGPQSERTQVERADFANRSGADLLISLHVGSAPSPRCEGVATYHFGTGHGVTSTVGERLAALVQREIVARTDLVDCRSHPKTWDLLRMTRMPAVRLELGHLTNDADRLRLARADFRDVVAEALLVAVQRLYLPAELDPPTGQLRMPALTDLLGA